MLGLAHDSHEFNDESSSLPESFSLSANGIWSKNRDDVSYNQLQKFWSELSPQARRELLRIDKKTLFDHARKNMYCSRCNGLLLEGFSQIVMYGKSLQQEGAGVHFPCGRPGSETNQNKVGSSIFSGMQDEIQDPTVQPWGGLTTTREGSLTLLDCYLCSKSLKGLQIVFDGARARERERELLYPDACGCGGCGWISQGIVSYGRGHGTRETCALHTAKLSCDTLVDFWSALGEETRQSLLKMKEEDFVERLMYMFDRKRFCKGCRRNVIREFKELKELKRMRREPRCTSWFCEPDTAFQYEVSDDSIQADWRQTFADTVGSYHHFEWAVGTREGKSDILEFDNVGTNGHVQVSGLDLGGLSACFITLRAWKLDGRCTEISVKAYALKGQQCVHGRLIVGDGYVTITKGESIRRFIEHAEEAEEDEDDDLMDKDGNEVGGECSRPQKHAKSPELAREFLLDAATVIFKEQVEKAFKEGTARQNAQSIFVCLALKLLEERVHVACKEIITLEKQMKLLEEEEKEKREEEERKERKRTKEREKKLRRKERLKGKEENKEIKCSESIDIPESPEVSKKDLSTAADIEQHNSISCSNSDIATDGDYPNIQDENFSSEYSTFRTQDHSYDDCDGQDTNNTSMFELEQSKFRRQRHSTKARHHNVVVSENGVMVGRYEPRHYGDNFGTSYRGIIGSTRQSRINVPKSNGRIAGHICNEKFYSSKIQRNNRYDFRSCSCSLNNGMARVSQETKPASNSESAIHTSQQFSRSSKNNHADSRHESKGRSKSRVISGNYPIRDFPQSKKVWEPMESHKKYAHCNLDSDVTLRSTGQGFQFDPVKSSVDEAGGSGEIHDEDCNLKRNGMAEGCNCKNGIDAEAKESCSSTEIASKEPEICLPRVTALNNSFNLIQGSISISDNCSPCLSECDINATSSNHETTESSTSDSEDASQHSEVRDSSTCIDNSLPGSHEAGIEKTHFANGDGLASRSLFGSSLDVAGSDALGKPMVEMAHNFDDGFYSTYVYPQPQSLHPPLPNKNTQFTVSKTPSATGYYHQNPVSRPFARTNALMHFPHEDQYFYPGPLGYSLNDDPCFCLQYGALHQPVPLFHTAAIPDCQSVSRAKGLNGELTQVSKPSSMRGHINGPIAERVVSPGANTQRTPLSVEVEQDDAAKLQDNNGGFSLFHFGGPVSLSTGYISSTASSNHDNCGDFDPKRLTSPVEKDHGCSKKETTVIEEYNLFAASNTLRFSIF